ncbi:MAG TPA: phosphatase PAP2 family protein [Anaerolineaceae bacterium]|nr:phosphatase PAP2 family protein [Anaerolineaceae bacterium]
MRLERLLQQDIEITNRLRLTNPESRLKPFAIFLAHSGDSWFILLALLIIWLVTKGLWHSMTALMAAGSVGLALVVLAIKFTIRRRRPEGKWGAIYRNTDPHSFPSGHAARTAMLAVIALAIGPLWFGLILLVWAPLVSLARVWMGVHYFSDVIVGMLIGVLAGVVVLQLAPWLSVTFPAIF